MFNFILAKILILRFMPLCRIKDYVLRGVFEKVKSRFFIAAWRHGNLLKTIHFMEDGCDKNL